MSFIASLKGSLSRLYKYINNAILGINAIANADEKLNDKLQRIIVKIISVAIGAT